MHIEFRGAFASARDRSTEHPAVQIPPLGTGGYLEDADAWIGFDDLEQSFKTIRVESRMPFGFRKLVELPDRLVVAGLRRFNRFTHAVAPFVRGAYCFCIACIRALRDRGSLLGATTDGGGNRNKDRESMGELHGETGS
jgi:hypothetical protein